MRSITSHTITASEVEVHFSATLTSANRQLHVTVAVLLHRANLARWKPPWRPHLPVRSTADGPQLPLTIACYCLLQPTGLQQDSRDKMAALLEVHV